MISLFELRDESQGTNEVVELIEVGFQIFSQNVFGKTLRGKELKITVAKESARDNKSFVDEFHHFEFLFVRRTPS
jgi:hypothetical protein